MVLENGFNVVMLADHWISHDGIYGSSDYYSFLLLSCPEGSERPILLLSQRHWRSCLNHNARIKPVLRRCTTEMIACRVKCSSTTLTINERFILLVYRAHCIVKARVRETNHCENSRFCDGSVNGAPSNCTRPLYAIR